MKHTSVELVKKRKATPAECDQLEFYVNKNTEVPKAYKLFGMSGVTFLAIVILLAAWTSVFLAEVQRSLFMVFHTMWKLGMIYTLVSLTVFGIIWFLYHHTHRTFLVVDVYCSDAVENEMTEDIIYVFQTENNEQFTMIKSQFAYVPVSFSVQVNYILAFDPVHEQYVLYQPLEEA